MHGCRKAPIMTIGINPNLTAYFPSAQGSEWAYPHSDNPAHYAYYYRYQTIYQESLKRDLIEKWVIAGTELVAQQDGVLHEVERSKALRWMRLTYSYTNGEKQYQEFSWSTDERAVVFADKKFNEDTPFKKGDLLAAKTKSEEEKNIQIYKNDVGYYKRILPIIEQFKKTDKTLSNSDICVGEDIAQHDLIHCASPGWSKNFDIPMEAITHNCVKDRQFLLQQLYMTSPKLIMLVGGSSLSMFAEILGDSIPFAFKGRDIFDLLRETCEREYYLEVKEHGLRARLIACPHFSYPDNYKNHARYSATSWLAFGADYPQDQKLLQEKGYMRKGFNDVVMISLEDIEPADKAAISVAAWQDMEGHFIEPYALIVNAWVREYQLGKLKFDDKHNRLLRTEGGCKFCNNTLWQFPEKCPYGKDQK